MASTDFLHVPGKLRVRQIHVRNWTFSVGRQYVGDMYGYKGSHGWQISFTLIRNP